MTWRRLTRAQARAEALAEYRAFVRDYIETSRMLRELFEEDDRRSAAARDLARPFLRGMSSAQLLDVLHSYYRAEINPLPCDDHDVLTSVLDELDRRRDATAHERIRLQERDRTS